MKADCCCGNKGGHNCMGYNGYRQLLYIILLKWGVSDETFVNSLPTE